MTMHGRRMAILPGPLRSCTVRLGRRCPCVPGRSPFLSLLLSLAALLTVYFALMGWLGPSGPSGSGAASPWALKRFRLPAMRAHGDVPIVLDGAALFLTRAERILTQARTQLDTPVDPQDMVLMAEEARTFRSLFQLHQVGVALLQTAPSNPALTASAAPVPLDALERDAVTQALERADGTLREMEERLFPWLTRAPAGQPNSTLDLLAAYRPGSQGIILSTGNWHFRYAKHSILMIRELGSTLPIEVYYCGRDDLDEAHARELEAIPDVRVLDLAHLLDNHAPHDLSGWAMKPFAMLLSRFEEAIFVDADATFMQPPENMLAWPMYRKAGALFFRDRTMGAGVMSTLDFARSVIPSPSTYALTEGRVYRKLSLHEGESGVVVVRKDQAGFLGMLTTCLLNSKPYRDHMYKVIHGDKESYWMAFEMLGLPYVWGPGAGGTLGYLSADGKAVCGGIYHPDLKWRPLWFNGGITANKHSEKGRNIPMNLTHFATDKSFRRLHWEWETETTPFCLTPANPAEEMGPLTGEERAVAKLAVNLWLNVSSASP